MSAEFLKYLPQQWVGLAAILMFGIYIALQVIEKYPTIAKIFPFGQWWHDRQRNKHPRLDEAIEDNEVIIQLQKQVATVAEAARLQALEIIGLNQTVRIFRAWSEFDALWHYRVRVTNAGVAACKLPKHYDFFEFEQVWRADPAAAANL